MKRLLLPLLAAFALPLEPSHAFLLERALEGKIYTACEAHKRGYLTSEQRDELLIEAYEHWNDQVDFNRAKRFKIIEEGLNWRKEFKYPNCFQELEKYILKKKNRQ